MDLHDHIDDLAQKLANNHSNFESFAWSARPDDGQNWTIVYTSQRDNECNALVKANSVTFADALRPFSSGDDPDVQFESHNHWAVGYMDGFSIRVYRGGEITEAFRTYAELELRREDGEALDEELRQRYREQEMHLAINSASKFVLDQPEWMTKVRDAMTDDWLAEQSIDIDEPYFDNRQLVWPAFQAELLDIEEFCDWAGELDLGPATLFTMEIGSAEPCLTPRVRGAYVLKIGDRVLRTGVDFTCPDGGSHRRRLPYEATVELVDMLVFDPDAQETPEGTPAEYLEWLLTSEADEVRAAIYDLLNPDEDEED